MTQLTTAWAVITGDIVGFTAFPVESRDRLLSELAVIAVDLHRGRLGSLEGEIDTFRGDSWQLVLRDPGAALAVAVLIRARLRALGGADLLALPVDSRVAVGIGAASRIDPERASRGQGPAFELSGRALDQLDGGRRLAVSVDESAGDPRLAAALSGIFVLLDALVGRWTGKQSRACAETILGKTQREIAAEWIGGAVSQQAIAQHLEAASWDAVAAADESFRRCWDAAGTGGD